MVGIDLGSVEGMGTPKGTSFDLAITSEEGKFPINCGGGYNPNKEAQRSLYMLLDSLVRPPRFDRLFQVPDRDGVVINREDVPTNIIDWTDVDVSRYSPSVRAVQVKKPMTKVATGTEPHNQYFDTIEMIQVRGVSEDLWAYFGDFFHRVRNAGLQVLASAMEPTAWPLLAAMIAASAVDRTAVFDPNTSFVAQQLAGHAQVGSADAQVDVGRAKQAGFVQARPALSERNAANDDEQDDQHDDQDRDSPPASDAIETLSM